jgi:hypothetical protein
MVAWSASRNSFTCYSIRFEFDSKALTWSVSLSIAFPKSLFYWLISFFSDWTALATSRSTSCLALCLEV